MGLPDACLIEGQDGHVAEFICAVCCALVDAPLLTRCNHIFCMACLQKWIDEKPSCPTCSMELDPRHGAGELKLASPLAWRVLGRLRVSCPLDNCGWQGDYSELMSHMTSSTSHQAPSDDVAMPNAPPRGSTPSKARSPVSGAASATNQSEQHAEALNTAAKSKFEQRVYTDALTLYSKAIANAPSVPKYLLNRAATHFALSSYSDAIADCAAAVALDPTLVKAHRRMARAYVELGEYAKAAATLERASTVDAAAASELAPDLELASQLHAWQSEGEAAMGQHEYSVARAFFANILGKTSAPRSKLWMVRSELALGLCDRALRTCTELIKADGNAAEAYVLRATALMYAADLDQARKHLREALRLDPDHPEGGRTLKRVRKLEQHVQEGKAAYNRRDFQGAHVSFSSALEAAELPQHAPLSATLHAERASTSLRLQQYDHALRDATVALYAQDDCKSAWVTKAAALQALGQHEQALRELEPVMASLGHDAQISGAYNRAQFEVRKARRPDYYALLRVPTRASTMEVRAAYREQALIWHPDKHATSEEGRRVAEERFKLIGEALETLVDDFKRKLWDEGYDKAAVDEKARAAERAAREEPRGHHHHH